jgi:uncharacterized protein (TIGR02588 family)
MADADKESPKESRPLVEWIVGAASALLVVALVAFLTYEALFAGDQPPDLTAEVISLQNNSSGTSVMVRVTNHGDQAAAAVVVTASLQGAERKTIQLDYVSGKASQMGAFQFASAVSGREFRVEVEGYAEP